MLMLAKLTLRETLAKKTFIAFALVSTIFLLLLIFAFQIDIVKGSDAMLNVFGQDIQDNNSDQFNVKELIKGFMAVSSSTLMLIGIILSIFATAGLIPSMLEKGTIDLILSKPLSRIQILVGRSLGAVSIVFINISYLVFGIWFILGAKTGFWMFEFLYLIPTICLVFLVMYSWMVLLGIMLRSSALTIMITYMLYLVNLALMARDQIYALLNGKFWIYLLDALFYIIPRTGEMISYPVQTYMENNQMPIEPFVNSFIVAIAIFALAAYLFKKKDF